MLVIAAQSHAFLERGHTAIDAGLFKSFFQRAGQHFLVKALTPENLGGQNGGRLAGIPFAQLLDDGVLALRCQLPIASRAMLMAQFAEQQPEEMIDFGKGGHRRAAAGMADALLDGDCRRQTGDQVHIRTFEYFHVLANIGRQAFQVAALPLGKQNIESQGGFARPRNPAEHHQLVLGNGQVDVF